MIKKLLLSFFIALPLLAWAQAGVGQWKIHPYFLGANAKNCIDAGSKVYYLASGSLFCFDKTTQTNKPLDAISKINDVNISQIYYNYSKQYLVVAYDDCNIDVIHSDGQIVNIPAIKDVIMHKAKKINDITFCNGKVYVATSFGFITLNDETFDVKEVRNYDVNIASVAEVGGLKLIAYNNKSGILYCGANEQTEVPNNYQSSKSNTTFTAGIDATASGGKKLVKTPITITCDSVIDVDESEYSLVTNSITTITISAGYRISKIELIGSSTSNPVSGLKANTGSYTTSDNVGTWTGEARTIKFTANDECKVSQIIVHYALLTGKIYPINDTKFFYSTAESFSIMTIGHHTDSNGADSCDFTMKTVVGATPVTLQPYPAGFVASFGSKNYYYTILPDASKTTKVTGNELYTSQEEGNWWVLGTNGLAHIENGVKSEYIKPNGISITTNAYWTTYDPSQQRVLLCRTTDNFVLDGLNSSSKTEVNSYDGTNWRNITPVNAPDLGGNTNIVVSPNEPNTYYYCTRTTGGICKVKDDSVVIVYDATNSPYNYRASLRFDTKGNLWMPQTHITDVMVLTPNKQLLTEVDPSMFIINELGDAWQTWGFKRQVFDIGADNIKVFSDGEYFSPLVFWNNNDDLSLKQKKVHSTFTDQDGKSFSSWAWVYLKADKDSMIWVGTASGVISFDPREAFNDDFRINRVKYTKSEGVDVSGNLIEGNLVTCIDVDSLNRKWFGTYASGVFFVSPDGSEIYRHFDTTNSPLPSDQVYSVCCNPATNSVLIVTSNGVVEYYCDVTPYESDYNNVYAYPNPVEPDFTGLITIKGLMNNSNIVITDDDGNVMHSMTSDGGMATWDGCDNAGNRLKTGIYKVYASQGETSTTEEPLTKIAIIK